MLYHQAIVHRQHFFEYKRYSQPDVILRKHIISCGFQDLKEMAYYSVVNNWFREDRKSGLIYF